MREVPINSTVIVEAMLTASSADTTVVGFPTPSLPNHTCKPKYTALKEIHQLLTSNTALVQSNLGGGQNGYLRLILPPEEYSRVSDTTYVRLPDLGITETAPEWNPPEEKKRLL